MIGSLLRRRSARLPAEVYCELIDLMYTALLPVSVLGLAATVLGGIIAEMSGTPAATALAVAAPLVTLARVALILAYHGVAPAQDPRLARRWEQRYALGAYASSLVVGLLDACALASNDPLQHMLAVGLALGYASGLVTRLSVRPRVCSISLLLAVLPTLFGLSLHFVGRGPLARAAYVALFFLIAAITLISLEAIRHLYRTTLRQLMARRELGQLARQDVLTCLPNRLQLRESLEAELGGLAPAGAAPGGRLLALHALDLDQFKPVNDRFGHAIGDALLQAVAGRLLGLVAGHDVVARLGGDEFVVLQSNLQHVDEARLFGHRIVRALSAPYRIGGHDLRIGTSVGVALAPRDGRDVALLLACADHALYAAKRSGRGRVILAGEEPAPPNETRTIVR